jgi:hypothetical protein
MDKDASLAAGGSAGPKAAVGLAGGSNAANARFHPTTEVRSALASAGIDKKLSASAIVDDLEAVMQQTAPDGYCEWCARSVGANRIPCSQAAEADRHTIAVTTDSEVCRTELRKRGYPASTR